MTTATKTLEQLQADAQAAAEALQTAQRAAADAEREAKYAAQRAESERLAALENTKIAALMAPIGAALKAAGIVSSYKADDRSISINTGDTTWSAISIRAEAELLGSGSGFYARSRTTGRYIVVLREDSGTPHRYPPLKAGGYNVGKMIDVIRARLNAVLMQAMQAKAKAAKMQSAAELAEQVRVDNGYAPDATSPIVSQIQTSYQKCGRGGYAYHTHTPKAGHVFLQLGNYEATPEEAKLLLDALKAIVAMRAAAKAS